MSFKDFMRKAKNAPKENQKWGLISLVFVAGLLVWWILNFL